MKTLVLPAFEEEGWLPALLARLAVALREEYTPIWLGVALGIAALSLAPPLLVWLTRAIGAWTPSSTLFFFGELFLLAICLNYAVRLSDLTLQIKNLAQELAVLRGELEAAHRSAPGEPPTR